MSLCYYYVLLNKWPAHVAEHLCSKKGQSISELSQRVHKSAICDTIAPSVTPRVEISPLFDKFLGVLLSCDK